MNIITHDFGGNQIDQLLEDTVIGGKTIPKGYVNATAMCKANGKTWSSYARSAKAKSFADKVSTALLNGSPAIYSVEGGNDKDVQGSWVHIDVAIHLSMWISDDFAVWATEVLRRVINGEFEALTDEAREAQERIIKLWHEIRDVGKVERRKLTDSIKAWYDRNVDYTDMPDYLMYAITTNAIYRALWNKTAKELEIEANCERYKVRDQLSTKSLKDLERAEANVAEYIDLDNLKPTDAVNVTNIRSQELSFKVELAVG